jgi:predicted amidohydrolase YtcJ
VKTLYRRGRIGSPTDPRATALLVEGEQIVWIGDEYGAPGADRTVDLEDGWVTPAFVDAHVHATSTGLQLSGLDLSATNTLADALDAIQRAAERLPADGVRRGGGWDETRWPEHRPPTNAELDRAASGRQVYLSRVDVHSAVCSSALLGDVEHEHGVVRQDAHHAVRQVAYASITTAQRAAAQRAMLERAASLGIAAVHECSGPQIAGEQDFLALLALAAEDALPEVVGYWAERNGVEKARELGARGAAGDLFADGSIGSRTAAMNSPYADDDPHFSHSGEPYLTEEEVAQHVLACTRADLQAGFHCIGDAAIKRVVAGLELAAELLGDAAVIAARHRLEHVELIGTTQATSLARLGVVASVQPAFDAAWGGQHGMYAERLGAWRAGKLNPFAELVASGVELALGSDAPVTPLDPWGAVRAAVQHRTHRHAVTLEQAVRAHTIGGWRAARDDASGVLAPHAPASFAVWDRPFALDAANPTCRLTVRRGEPIFRL